MSTLQVTREGQVILTARNGAVKFWAAILGVSVSPMIAWGVAAFWIAVARSRPPPPG
jgi:hypothetical protein